MGEDHIAHIPGRFVRDKVFLLCWHQVGQQDIAILSRGSHEVVNANNHLALAVILKHLMGVIDVAMLIDQCVTGVAP